MAKLRKIRIEKGYTQQDLALILNISQACYNRYEQGKREPSIETLRRLCVLFNISADELLEIETKEDRKKVVINHSFNNFTALALWLILFFSSGSISPNVFPASGK